MGAEISYNASPYIVNNAAVGVSATSKSHELSNKQHSNPKGQLNLVIK